jgi:hypothetical protein
MLRLFSHLFFNIIELIYFFDVFSFSFFERGQEKWGTHFYAVEGGGGTCYSG